MALIEWSDEYSVKVNSIDNQHIKLVEMVNTLHSAMKEGKGKEVIGKVISDLVSYTETHFAHEEDLMKKHSYPEYSKHKAMHDELVGQVKEIEKSYKEGKTVLSHDILNFLKSWLMVHIGETDKRLGSYLVSKSL